MTLSPANRRFFLVSTALSLTLMPLLASALPTGGSVVQGSATISSTATQTTVNQSSQNAVINWKGFGIANGQTVQFNDPNSSSITLNRISGPATSINGALNSNGNVWLINPNGILFDTKSKVNVGGLLATTSNITDSDFMAGNYNFASGAGPKTAAITNRGSITVANAGLATLVGPNVANGGTITANLGKITLAAGDTYTVDLAGDGLINLQASPAVTALSLANSGTLNAAGGKVEFTAAQAAGLLDNVINLNGVINADNLTADNQGGDLNYGAKFNPANNGDVKLSAYRNVTMVANSAIGSSANTGPATNVTLDANSTGAAGGGAIYVGVNASVNSHGGNIVMGGGADPTTGSAVGNGVSGNYTNGIYMAGNSVIRSSSGNLILNGTGAPSVTTGNADGVNINTANLNTEPGGAITINGKGGNTASGASTGIALVHTSVGNAASSVTLNGTGGNAHAAAADGISATTTGFTANNISITGKGGTSAGNVADGIMLTNAGLLGGIVANITGTGGNGLTATGVDLSTVLLQGASLALDGVNSFLTLTGTGGSAAANGSDMGVYFHGTNTIRNGYSYLISGNAGTSTGKAAYGDGVLITNTDFNYAASTSQQITGIGSDSLATRDSGVHLAGGVTFESHQAGKTLVSITGTGKNGAADIAADKTLTNVVNTINFSTIPDNNFSFTGDSLAVAAGSLTINATGNVTFAPRNALTAIGVAGGPGTLNLTSAILNGITAGNITIGSTADSGAMTIGAYSWKNNVTFLNGVGNITLTGVNTTAANGSITLATLMGNFINTAGAGALAPGAGGRYLIYTNTPANDTLGGMTPDFQQFGCTYGDSCSGLPTTGNGLVYSQLSR